MRPVKEEVQNPAFAYIAGRIDKMLVPALLYFLAHKPAHGYELIQKVNGSGFSEIEADPATIYRNLRRMEEDGLVISQWETEHTGPARRAYQLSPEGYRALDYCVQLITDKVARMQAFLEQYQREVKGSE
ncbi:MAG: PadR family transcriptional regulator [Firmicutes bacterium]|uniref:Poly-beta-hydroxybutyrate-responsive repressor n=1 Tax=Desulforamulus putei DSM 12395 TaxID=1121429 RepID=A0A1M4WBB0_9FIRM|nr:PadR family transcriptional regulator [Desulforamulus putei]MCL4441881.1 PadR family transcriptional regulator [Bacillota bacterium]SHE78252.1 poly-beta-hydroxybutyrate-responsive repressor [Desulforamulus putei DSM 12395]